MIKQIKASKIIRSYVLWSMGGGLIPIPIVDFAAVTAIQLEMLSQLASLYDVDYSETLGKAFVSALTGTTIAQLGSSIVKIIPGLGTLLGGASMSLTSGASTYAIGQVAINHFANSGTLNNFVEEQVKKAYNTAFQQGRSYVSNLEHENNKAADSYLALEKLGKLREQGILNEEEFQAKKKELLERL